MSNEEMPITPTGNGNTLSEDEGVEDQGARGETNFPTTTTPQNSVDVVRNGDDLPEFVQDGKNKLTLNCIHCPSKIMEPLMASFHVEEKTLPKMSQKKDRKDLEVDTVSEWFMVEDIMTFENIGVSNAVDQTKYLTCADCEMGPVGWTDLSNKKCYVALCRVRQT